MVYVLVVLSLYFNGDVQRFTVVFPNEGLCEAAAEGIYARMEQQQVQMANSGIERVVMKCVKAKEA